MNDTLETNWHVWDYIAEELAERGWSKLRLALEMGGDRDVTLCSLDLLEATRDPNMLVGEDTDAGLSRAFGTSPGFWIRLHERWRQQTLDTGDTNDGT